jgi:hypothetical protein
MNKRTLFVIGAMIVVACIAVAGYFFERSKTVQPASTSTQSAAAVLDPLNATYIVEGSAVALANGKSEQAAAPGSAEIITTQIFGTPVLGDVNGDGVNDAAVIITQTGAGSGTFYYAAVALATSSEIGSGSSTADAAADTIGTNAILLGDRIAPDTTQIENGIITVNYADRKSTDPMTTQPSVGVSKYLVVKGTTLYDTPSDIYPLPSGITWNAAQSATIAPGDANVSSTLAGIKITSQPITNITDLAAPSTPFENYYKKKLVAAGWIVDNALAAGGPGADITGYKKGDNYIILEYTSVFKNDGGGNSPETCPCDLTFSIFAGTEE